MRIDKNNEDIQQLKKRLYHLYNFTHEVIIYRLLLKPGLEVIDHVSLLDNNDRIYLDLRIKVKKKKELINKVKVDQKSEEV